MGRSRRGGGDIESTRGLLDDGSLDTQLLTDDVIPDEALRALMDLPSDDSSGDPIAWQLLGHCLEQLGEQEQASHCYANAARRMVQDRRTESVPMPLPFAVYMEPPTNTDH